MSESWSFAYTLANASQRYVYIVIGVRVRDSSKAEGGKK